MIYIVTYTTHSKYKHLKYAGNSMGLARHTTKSEAEHTVRKTKDKCENLEVRQFKNMSEASDWVNAQNLAYSLIYKEQN